MTARSDIPQNVADNIVSALVRSDRHQWLGQYATVSRHFQRAIEAQTFRELYLTSARLDDLSTVATTERLRHVQIITLHVGLASYRSWQGQNRESQDDLCRTTRVFTSAVQELFATISTWDPKHLSSAGIHLELLVESPSDDSTHRARSHMAPSKTKRARESTAGMDVYGEALPQVNVVSALTCSGTGRHIQLETVSTLLDKLPDLRLLDAELEHDTSDEKDLHARQVFIMSLEHCAPNITDLRFRRPHTPPTSGMTGSSTFQTTSRSLFYTHLIRYTQRCIALTFDDSVDALEYLASFEEEGELEQQHPYWPYLERLHIKNTYLMRRPYMRVKTQGQAMRKIDRIVLLMGRAVRYMPKVSDVKLRMYVFVEGKLEQKTVQYNAWNGGAQIKFSGTTPTRATMDTWKESVSKARGSELRLL